MARYRLKRKTFGVVDAAGSVLGNTAGGVMKGVGAAADSKIGRVAGGALGAMTIGKSIGAALGGPLGMAGGMLAGYIGGKALTGGIGTGLKKAGQNLQDRSM